MDTGKSNPAHWSILCYWNMCKTWSSMNCHVIWFLINEKYTNNQGKVQACLPSSAFCNGSTKGLTVGQSVYSWVGKVKFHQATQARWKTRDNNKEDKIPSYLFRANPFPRYSLFFLFIFQKHFILNPYNNTLYIMSHLHLSTRVNALWHFAWKIKGWGYRKHEWKTNDFKAFTSI